MNQPSKVANKTGKKIIATNKKAFHDYHILDRYEAGIVLVGTEVKSIRQGKINFKDSYIAIDKKTEAYIVEMHISPYEMGNRFNHEATRKRKLLLQMQELKKLNIAISEKGMTIVPVSVFFENGRAKLEIALAKGKHTYDKRQDLKEKSIKKDMAMLKNYR